jgi:hypothetical protein
MPEPPVPGPLVPPPAPPEPDVVVVVVMSVVVLLVVVLLVVEPEEPELVVVEPPPEPVVGPVPLSELLEPPHAMATMAAVKSPSRAGPKPSRLLMHASARCSYLDIELWSIADTSLKRDSRSSIGRSIQFRI